MSDDAKSTPRAITLVDAYVALAAAAGNADDGRLAIAWANFALEIAPNHAEALLCRGIGFEQIKEFKAAMRDFERVANSGDAYALCFLSVAFDEGKMMERRPDKVFSYAQLSADGGSLSGALMLGRCFLKGIGVEKDENKARSLFEKVAYTTEIPHIERVAGHLAQGRAFCELGWMCLRGQGGFKADPYAAMEYDRRSAEQGLVTGMQNYALSLFQLRQSSADHSIAFQWLLRAHRKAPGNQDIIQALIRCYRQGRGTGRNELEAKRFERMLKS